MSDKFLTPIIYTKSLIGYVLLKSAVYTEHKQKGYTFTLITFKWMCCTAIFTETKSVLWLLALCQSSHFGSDSCISAPKKII